jgi:hypothetical protein
MRNEMSSRQRILQAFIHSEVDHVPLLIRWWSRQYLSNKNDSWRDQFERVLKTTNLGLDDAVEFEPPRMFNPEVTVKVRRESRPGERYPMLFKEYHTPKGVLSQVAYQTDDWPHGGDMPIFTDFLVPRSRSKKYLVETLGDVEALSVLFSDPSEKLLRQAREQADKARRFAEKNEVVLESGANYLGSWLDGSGLFLGDALGWLCGLENAIMFAYRQPELLHRLLDTILEWNLRHIRLVSELGGADIVVHRAWYETFWSPRLFRTFFAPRIRKEINYVHRIGAKFCYIMTSGLMPLLEPLAEMGIDVLYGIDPVQGGADLRQIKQRIGDRVCLWGGMNSAVTLASRESKDVETGVKEAIESLAPRGGFVLAPIDQLFEDTRWENVLTMIEIWRKLSHART